ncbi:MAG: hypothetical protein Q8M16_19945 [Pirellulaceae bacterium]|nr:hypothetical protein [Pirellulaceae bacterium]
MSTSKAVIALVIHPTPPSGPGAINGHDPRGPSKFGEFELGVKNAVSAAKVAAACVWA